MVKTRIVNVVATASLGQELDLYDLEKFKEIRHDPEIYGGRVAYFKLSNMKGRVSIFLSGKMISVGTKSEYDAAHELNLTKDFLVKNYIIKPVNIEPKTQNIVALVEINKGLNLEELANTCKMIYEPEQFPGGILRFNNPKATVLVFASGKAIITGLKDASQVEQTAKELVRTVKTLCS